MMPLTGPYGLRPSIPRQRQEQSRTRAAGPQRRAEEHALRGPTAQPYSQAERAFISFEQEFSNREFSSLRLHCLRRRFGRIRGRRRLAENQAVRVLLIEAGGSDDVPEVTGPSQWPPTSAPTGTGASLRSQSASGRPIDSPQHGKGSGRRLQHQRHGLGEGPQERLGAFRRRIPAIRPGAMTRCWQSTVASRTGKAGTTRCDAALAVQCILPRPPTAAGRAGDGGGGAGPRTTGFDTPNGEMMEGRGGVAINDLIVRDGRRSSIYRSYVHPRLPAQPDGADARSSERADLQREVCCRRGSRPEGTGLRHFFADREVILSMGAINTPKVLMQSGIGPKAEFRRHGIEVVEDLPGVGRNHQDHVSFGGIFECREPQPSGMEDRKRRYTGRAIRVSTGRTCFTVRPEFAVPSAETASFGVPRMGGPCSRDWRIRRAGASSFVGTESDDPILIQATRSRIPTMSQRLEDHRAMPRMAA